MQTLTRLRTRARREAGELAPQELARALDLPPQRYGPRGRTGAGYGLVSEYTRLGPRWFGAQYETRAHPTPHGGWRYVIRCPRCGRFVLHLYTADPGGPGSPGPWWCRHCWQLRYDSAYTLRRPRASHERLAALWAQIWRARSAEVRARRLARFGAQCEAMHRYEHRWLAAFLKHTPRWMLEDERDAGLT